MADEAQTGWDRRDFLGGAALLALALGVPVATLSLTELDPAATPSPAQIALLREVCQLVIPRTGTPGAGEVGTAEFVVLALAHGLEGSARPVDLTTAPQLARFRRADGALNHLAWLEHQLGAGFTGHDPATRTAALGALDAAAYAEGVREHPWRVLKALILTGYYTSQIGGAQELRFELVPGRWEADLPLTPQMRALSSDWTAVDFG